MAKDREQVCWCEGAWARSFAWLCLIGLSGAVTLAQQVSLNVSPPNVKPCGNVEVSGGFTAPGLQSTPPTWTWGDGETTQSFFPAKHRYRRAGTYTLTVALVQGGNVLASRSLTITIPAIADPVCSEVLVVEPAKVNLRDGQTSRIVIASRVSPSGTRTVLDSSSVLFRSLNPSLIATTESGTVTAAGFGDGQIEVEDKNTGQVVRLDVTAGELELSPAYVRLHLTANPEVQLRVVATRADNRRMDLAGRTVRFFDPNPAPATPVVSVSNTGLVRAFRVPASVNETPILHVSVDGVLAGNTTIVRVADAFPEIEFTELSSGRTVFQIARQVPPDSYEEILRGARAAEWTNLAFEFESEAAGYRTDRGGVHWFGNDVGGTADPSDPTVPCGISGNPTRLGVNPANPQSSCLVIAGPDPTPQWFVFFHETGHDYAGQNARFQQWIEGAQGAFRMAIVEGMATAFGQYAGQTMRERQSQYRIPGGTLQQLERTQGFPDAARWRGALDQYVAEGSRFAGITPDVFSGITGSLMTEFGAGWFARFASVLLPVNTRFDFPIGDDRQAATFMAAATSASAERDLRDRFRTWGFPLDDSYYDLIRGQLAQLSKARAPVAATAGVVSAASFTPGNENGAMAVVAPAQWISIFGTSLAPRFVVGETLAPSLEGTSVEFLDASGVARPGTLQFVSSGHINVLVPESLTTGSGQIRIKTFIGASTVPVSIAPTQPGIFSSAASGRGPAAATWLQVSPEDGRRTAGLTFDPNTLRNVPIDLRAGETYISFFGTGFRAARSDAVTARVGGQSVPVLGAVAQGQFAGLDQLTVGPLPDSLAGRGEVDLEVNFEGKSANRVSIAVR